MVPMTRNHQPDQADFRVILPRDINWKPFLLTGDRPALRHLNLGASIFGGLQVSPQSPLPLRTSLQRRIFPCADGSQSFFSSATVIDVAHVFFGCTTIARPSYATGSSMNWTPVFAHSSASTGLIGRDASAISISSRQNFATPPPVPEIPTVMRVPGRSLWNSSATASVTG